MNLLLYGKNAQDIKTLCEELGFGVVEENPDVVISYGGDGTLLAAERKFPEIPKLPIRDSKVCKKCSPHETKLLLKLLKEDKLLITQQPKLETEFEGNKLVALNDIVVRNASAYHAIRFHIALNGIRYNKSLIIGDGIVVSTAFGSTGYYQSITRSTFDKNFRIVFNNSVTELDPLEFTPEDEITMEIVRGPGELTCDNNPETIELEAGNQLLIKVSSQTANIFSPETLRCNNCEIKRDQRLHD